MGGVRPCRYLSPLAIWKHHAAICCFVNTSLAAMHFFITLVRGLHVILHVEPNLFLREGRRGEKAAAHLGPRPATHGLAEVVPQVLHDVGVVQRVHHLDFGHDRVAHLAIPSGACHAAGWAHLRRNFGRHDLGDEGEPANRAAVYGRAASAPAKALVHLHCVVHEVDGRAVARLESARSARAAKLRGARAPSAAAPRAWEERPCQARKRSSGSASSACQTRRARCVLSWTPTALVKRARSAPPMSSHQGYNQTQP